MDDVDSPQYFMTYRNSNETTISDYNIHFDVYEKTANFRNKMLSQKILEYGVEMGHIKFSAITEVGSIFEDTQDIVYLNLCNVLKAKDTLRLNFLKENHQKIYDIFTKFEDKNIKTMNLLNLIILKTLPSAIMLEEGNLSAAERISLIYISSLKSLSESLRQQKFNTFVTNALHIFIKIYETVVEPILIMESWCDHVSLNYLLAKLQSTALEFVSIFKESYFILDLHLKISILYFISLSLTYEKRYFEERFEGPINPNDFQFYKSRKAEIQDCLKSFNTLFEFLKRLDFSTLKKVSKTSFYFQLFTAQSDERIALAKLTFEMILYNTSPGSFKLCFPQTMGLLMHNFSSNSHELIDRMVSHGFRNLREGCSNDNLMLLSMYYLIILSEKLGIERILKVSEIFQTPKTSDNIALQFKSSFFNIFTYFSIQSKSGLFFKTNFDIFTELLKSTSIQTFTQIALIKVYLYQLLTDVPDEVITYLEKNKLSNIDVKEQTLYFLVLTNTILKFKYSPENIPEGLIEVVKNNIFSYTKLLSEDPNNLKIFTARIFYKLIRKFCLRIEKAFPTQFLVISNLLKGFCSNQKDNLTPKSKKLPTLFKEKWGECEIIPSLLIFSPIYSCPETGHFLTTLLLLHYKSLEKATYYLTNNNITFSFQQNLFKITEAFELTGIIDPIQFNVEVFVSNGGCFARANLFNSSNVLIKDIVLTVSHSIEKFKFSTETINIENFPPNSKKNFNLKFSDICFYDFRIDCKIQVMKIDYEERNILQEDENENNKIEDSIGSDDEMNRIYTINCEQVKVPFFFFFFRVDLSDEQTTAYQFARNAFHLKSKFEYDHSSPNMSALLTNLSIRLEDKNFFGLFKNFAKSTYFILEINRVGEKQKFMVKIQTHSRKVFKELKKFLELQ